MAADEPSDESSDGPLKYAALLDEARTLQGVSLGRDAWRRLRKNRLALLSLVGLVLLGLLAWLTPFLPLQPPRKVNTALRYAPPAWELSAPQPLTLGARLAEVPAELDKAKDDLAAAREALLERIEQARKVRDNVIVEADRLERARKDLLAAEQREREAVQRVEDSAVDPEIDDKQALVEYEDARDDLEIVREDHQRIADAVEWATSDVGWANYAAEMERRETERHRERIRGIIQAPYKDEGFPHLGIVGRAMVRFRLTVFGKWSLGSLCGRDELGRDVLSRLFWGARISLIVGLVAALVSLVIGVTYGAISGYVGGWVDNAMMRVVDILYSIPFIFVVIYLVTILGQEDIKAGLQAWGIDRITVFFSVVGAIYWLTMARVVRGQVMSLKNEQFVEAARALGASGRRIIFRHLVPNLWSIIIVYLTLTIPRVMLFEAFLSFLGLGVEPPDVSWGLLANDGLKVINPVQVHWWLVVFPGLALGGTLFALNFLGDGLRDALDPRMKNQG